MHRPFVCIAMLVGGFGGIALAQRGQAPTQSKPLTSEQIALNLASRKIRFDLADPARLTNLVRVADELIRCSEAQEDNLQRRRKELLQSRSLEELTFPELREYFSEPKDFITKKDRRGLVEIRRQAEAALAEERDEQRRERMVSVLEIAAAINNNHRAPLPEVIDFLQPPLLFMDYLYSPVGRGDSPAANLPSCDLADASRINPVKSTFWSPADSIAARDLYHGFGRRELPAIEEKLWRYAGPKTSYGGSAGFEAACGSLKIKVKFNETTSEPFAARIFAALGYNVEPTDHVSDLKIRYDRRLFKEFHLRKEMNMQIRALRLVPIYTIHVQKRYDPFHFVAAVVMKDGSRLSGPELKTALLRKSDGKHPEDWPDNFRGEVEQRIAYLILAPANVQLEDEHARSIGPWDFDRFGHEDRRELRALGLLAAWVGWPDSRFDNTRLKIVKSGEGMELKHYITDLGGGLGKSMGALRRESESPNQFDWFCTRAPKFQGKGRMTLPFRIVNYAPIDDTLAFEKMALDDARWMARLIGQLTEAQIVQALVASGFDSAQIKIYTAKLISRRDQMMRDLDLTAEIKPLRPGGVDRHFAYDPVLDGPVKIKTAGGLEVVAKSVNLIVQDGRIVSHAPPAPRQDVPAGLARVRQEAESSKLKVQSSRETPSLQ